MIKIKFYISVILIFFISTLIYSCGSARRSDPFAGDLDRKDRQIARGQVVFMQKCQKCHPGGEGGLGPSLNDKPAPGFAIKFQVRNGLGAMPSFPESEISREELDDLVEYMIELRNNK